MEIIRHIKVDLSGDTQHFAVAAKQMDMGTRYIGVTLMEDGVVYEIPDNVEVIINMTKPDKTHVHNDGEKSGNEALIPLTRGMLQVHDFNPRSREGSDNNFHQKVLFSLSKNCLIHLFFITNFLN